jgi:hypothetical protein
MSGEAMAWADESFGAGPRGCGGGGARGGGGGGAVWRHEFRPLTGVALPPLGDDGDNDEAGPGTAGATGDAADATERLPSPSGEESAWLSLWGHVAPLLTAHALGHGRWQRMQPDASAAEEARKACVGAAVPEMAPLLNRLLAGVRPPPARVLRDSGVPGFLSGKSAASGQLLGRFWAASGQLLDSFYAASRQLLGRF